MTDPTNIFLDKFPAWVNDDQITNLLNPDENMKLSNLRYTYTTQISEKITTIQMQLRVQGRQRSQGQENNHIINLRIPRDLVIRDIIMIGQELSERFKNVYIITQDGCTEMLKFDFLTSSRPHSFQIEINI